MHQRSLERRVARRKSGLFRLDHQRVFVGFDDAHRGAAARAGLNVDADTRFRRCAQVSGLGRIGGQFYSLEFACRIRFYLCLYLRYTLGWNPGQVGHLFARRGGRVIP